MRQLSHWVFWMRSSSWIIQRVDATDWVKQKHTCREHQHLNRIIIKGNPGCYNQAESVEEIVVLALTCLVEV